MIPLTLSSPLSLSSPSLPAFPLFKLNHIYKYGRNLLSQKLKKKKKKEVQLKRAGICRAEIQQDAPYVIAMGACILSSLLLPSTGNSSSDDEDVTVTSADARVLVMTLISLIPYFNWLAWVFAFTDTSKLRYAVYAIVYLAPYFRTNLSVALEESLLPFTSIVLCSFHIQLDASVNNGDIESFNLFNEALKRLGLFEKRSHAEHPAGMEKEARTQGNMKLLLGPQSPNENRKLGVPKMLSQDAENLKEDG